MQDAMKIMGHWFTFGANRLYDAALAGIFG